MKSSMTLTTKRMAETVADATADAYSFDRYGASAWRACCRMLARRGHDAREIEAIMRSKHTRWAADWAGKNDGATSRDLDRYIDLTQMRRSGGWAKEVRSLVAETFDRTVEA